MRAHVLLTFFSRRCFISYCYDVFCHHATTLDFQYDLLTNLLVRLNDFNDVKLK